MHAESIKIGRSYYLMTDTCLVRCTAVEVNGENVTVRRYDSKELVTVNIQKVVPLY